MGYERIKTEHAGAKNGGGAWMTRAEAKQTAKHKRRQADKQAARVMTNGEPMPGVANAVRRSRESHLRRYDLGHDHSGESPRTPR